MGIDNVQKDTGENTRDQSWSIAAVHEAYKERVCNPKSISDYAIGFSTAGIALITCALAASQKSSEK